MRVSTAALLMVAVTPACAQMGSPFARMFLARNGNSGATSYSSSFMSSSSWVSGADGQMHQETHEVRRETTRDAETGEMVQRKQSEVNCKDGDCSKMVQLTAAAPRFHERMMARFLPRFMSLPDPQTMPGMKPGGLAPNGLPAEMGWAISHPPVVQEPVLVVRVVPRPGFLAPSPPTFTQATAHANSDAYKNLLGGSAAIAAAASVIAIAALLKCHRSGEAKARERPIRDLAQPLAPEEEAQMKCGAAVRPAAAASGAAPKVEAMYLSRVYNKAAEIVDMRATRAYLARVYNKATF